MKEEKMLYIAVSAICVAFGMGPYEIGEYFTFFYF